VRRAKMRFVTYSHKHADVILKDSVHTSEVLKEVLQIIEDINEDEIKSKFANSKSGKSISTALNNILKNKFSSNYWAKSLNIFNSPEYDKAIFTADYFKKGVLLSVITQHLGYLPGILLKYQLANIPNDQKKEFDGSVGVIIIPTSEMKKSGGFDGAISTFEECVSCLEVLKSIITTPILVVGLCEPETFRINHIKNGNTLSGYVMELGTKYN
jgi:hypothetical protein